jgi:hypothetical protein
MLIAAGKSPPIPSQYALRKRFAERRAKGLLSTPATAKFQTKTSSGHRDHAR